MTICLDAASTLRAIAGTGTALTMTVFGDEIAGGADSFKKLYQGQVATSITTVYTVPASTQSLLRSIMVLNTTASPVTFALYTDGAVAANQIAAFTLPANGEALYTSAGWQVLDSTGTALSSAASAAAFPVGVGALPSYSPTWTQGVTITRNVTYAKYMQTGKAMTVMVLLGATGAGTAAAGHKISLPVPMAAAMVNAFAVLGVWDYLDSGVAAYVGGAVIPFDANTVQFRVAGQDGGGSTVLGTSTSPTGNTNVAAASGDAISFMINYEAA